MRRSLFLLLLIPASCSRPHVSVQVAPLTYASLENTLLVSQIATNLNSYEDGSYQAYLEDGLIRRVQEDLDALDETDPSYPDRVRVLEQDFDALASLDQRLSRSFVL